MGANLEEQLYAFVVSVQTQTRPVTEFLPKDGLVVPATQEVAIARLRTNAKRFKFNYASLTLAFACVGLVFNSKTALIVLCGTVLGGYALHHLQNPQHKLRVLGIVAAVIIFTTNALSMAFTGACAGLAFCALHAFFLEVQESFESI